MLSRIYTSILAILCLCQLNVLAHYQTAYSHEYNSTLDNSRWMSDINNEMLLSRMSLPGTHDTMAFYGGDIAQCQSLPLEIQMRAGVRAFDIRCKHYDNTFMIHHGPIYQFANFNNVLDAMVQFLGQNPTETFIIRVKEEDTPQGNNRTFEETFLYYRTDSRYNNTIWNPINKNPKLGDVRGKIIVLQNFHASKLYGLDYDTFNIQDYYALDGPHDLYNKWEKVKAQIQLANSSTNGFYLNHLSGSSGSFIILNVPVPIPILPYFVASGHFPSGNSDPRVPTEFFDPPDDGKYPDFPRVPCILGICQIAYEGTNILTDNYLQLYKLKFIGIIMIDFPGNGLINAIIKINKT